MAQKILVVDDEESLAQFVCRALRQQGYKTVCAYDGDNALSLVYEEMPDLVILDLMLPLMDGWEICRRVKSDEETRHIPILMLTARSSAEDVVQGLDLGADDYMRKPFPLDELLARVRVLLRRSQGPADTKKVIEDRDFKLDTAEKEVWLRGSIIDLSPTEYSILEVLARRMGHTVSRDELLRKIWGLGSCDTRTVDVHMSRLRRKLDDGKKPTLSAQTLRGRGYRLTWEEGEYDAGDAFASNEEENSAAHNLRSLRHRARGVVYRLQRAARKRRRGRARHARTLPDGRSVVGGARRFGRARPRREGMAGDVPRRTHDGDSL